MEEAERSSFAGSGRKRGSVKCGLKSKVNIPKGGAVKPPIAPKGQSELEKVFAQLRSAQTLKPSEKLNFDEKKENAKCVDQNQNQTSNAHIVGTVAKLLKSLDDKGMTDNVKTLPPKSQKPVAVPRKTKPFQETCASNESSFSEVRENTPLQCSLVSDAQDLREKNKPKSATKPLPVSPKPNPFQKPAVTKKQETIQTQRINSLERLSNNSSADLEQIPVRKIPTDKLSIFSTVRNTSGPENTQNVHEDRKPFHKASPPIKQVSKLTDEKKAFNKAPPPPLRQVKHNPEGSLFKTQVPVNNTCSMDENQTVCSVNDGYEIMPEKDACDTTEETTEGEWSDISEDKSPKIRRHIKVHPRHIRQGSSKTRKDQQKKSSSKKNKKKGSLKNEEIYTDAISGKEQKSESDWETDEESKLVDSQGYEDVEKIREIVKALQMVEKQKGQNTQISMDSHGKSSVSNVSNNMREISLGDNQVRHNEQLSTQQYQGVNSLANARKHSVKQKRTSARQHPSPRASPKVPPRNVPKLPRKASPQLFRLSSEVPAPSENTLMPLPMDNTYADKRSTPPPTIVPRTKSTSFLEEDSPPEVPRRRRAHTEVAGDSSNSSDGMTSHKSRDSYGYLRPVDMPPDDLPIEPPPPLPPKGSTLSSQASTPSLVPSPPKLPTKSRSDSQLESMAEDSAPPLLPRKAVDKRKSVPLSKVLPPVPIEEEEQRHLPKSQMSITIPPPRDSLCQSDITSPGGNYVEPNPVTTGTTSIMKYLSMDRQNKKPKSPPVTEDGMALPQVAHRPQLNLNLQVPTSLISVDSEQSALSSSPKRNSYLKLLQDDQEEFCRTPETPDRSSLFSQEPLYQIYHCGAVLRDVMTNEIDDMEENEAIYDDAETVKGYVNSILSRVGSDNSQEGSSVRLAPSSLQNAVSTPQAAGMRTMWAEMKQVKESGILATIDPAEKKLQEAIFEILTSEASYLKSLDVLVSHFMGAPELDLLNANHCTLRKRDHQVLFSNVHRVRSVSKRFLNAVEKIWKTNCILDPIEIAELVKEFTEKHFDVYVKYCSNQVYQERELTQLKKTNIEFSEAVSRLEASPACHGLTLQSFLTLPMQRITRLPLLLDAVCHRMDSNKPEYEKIMQCLHSVQKLVKQCNEGARRMDNLEQVAEIDRKLEFKNCKRIAVVSQSRSLVKKGSLSHLLVTSTSGIFDKLKKKKETLHLFLFNDLMLITKRKSDESYQVIDHDARINIQADIISTAEAVHYPTSNKNLFKMVLLQVKHEYIFAAESESERMRWVEAVTPVQQQSEHERVYATWDCPQVQAVHKYTAQQPDELTLEESDVINVHRKMTDGWYEGERIRDGEVGWFPSTHVVEIQSSHVRARNLRQRYRMLQMSNDQFADMLANPQEAWRD